MERMNSSGFPRTRGGSAPPPSAEGLAMAGSPVREGRAWIGRRSIGAKRARRILLLGASGRTGQLVLDYALTQGLEVVALVRNPDRLRPRRGIEVMVGSPLDPSDIAHAIAGCDAVVSVLSHIYGLAAPWAPPLSPPLLLTHCIDNCIEAMSKNGVRRIVVMCAIGVGDSFRYAPAMLRWRIRHTNLRRAYADQNDLEQVLRLSGLAWTSVRAARLSDRRRAGGLIVSIANRPEPRTTISRDLAARFLIDCLSSRQYVGQTPSISEF